MKRFIVDTVTEDIQEEDGSITQSIKPANVPSGINYGIEYSDDKTQAIISINDNVFLEYPDLLIQLKDNEIEKGDLKVEGLNICSQFNIDILDKKAEILVDKDGLQKYFMCMCIRLAQNIEGFFYIINLVRIRD